jgi:hypothetical protein
MNTKHDWHFENIWLDIFKFGYLFHEIKYGLIYFWFLMKND